MKKKETPVYKFMTLNEIFSIVKFDKANRTSFIDEEENKKNGYNNKDYSLLKNRVKKYTNRIFKQNNYEWSLCCPLVIHYVNEVKEYYVTDGQGRLRSMEEAVRKGIITNDKEIPVLIITCDNMTEMRNDIKAMNTNNCNWNAADMIHSNAVALKGDSLKIEKLIKDCQDTLNVNSNFIPILLVLGEGHRKKDEIPTSLEYVNPFYDKGISFFKQIYDYFDTRAHTSSNLKKRIRSSNTGIALNSIFTNLMNECGGNYNMFDEVSNKILKKMFSVFDKEQDNYIMRIFSTNKVDCKNNIANFLLKYLSKNKIVVATANNILYGKIMVKVAA